jgi:competence protein ComFA
MCPICKNQDPLKIGIRERKPYCRACIMFLGEPTERIERPSLIIEPQIQYELTKEQRTLSKAILEAYIGKKHVIVDAVTGSGKTEIVFEVIQYALLHGQKVGMVIPRKDVVIEMVDRFAQVFPHLKIGAFYGGFHEKSDDFIVLTTHQIYHFESYFDLIIFDEVDAFPYQGNPVLKALVDRASIGSIVYLSATFDIEEMRTFKRSGGGILHLHKRYHGFPLPELTIVKVHKWLKLVVFIR